MGEKRCKWCAEVKPLREFYANPTGRDGLRPECKSCTRAYRSRWYAENADAEVARVKRWQQANADRVNASQRERRRDPAVKRKERDGHLRRKFGITIEQYELILALQGGVCAICKREPNPNISLHVDHDHETGAIRGLTCFRCNQALGAFGESATLLRAAADYLDRHDSRRERELAELDWRLIPVPADRFAA